MKKYLLITVSALSLGFGANTASAHPALAMYIVPQVLQSLPQILPIFGQVFGGFTGGGYNGVPVGQGAYGGYGDEEEYRPHHRKHKSHQHQDSNGY